MTRGGLNGVPLLPLVGEVPAQRGIGFWNPSVTARTAVAAPLRGEPRGLRTAFVLRMNGGREDERRMKKITFSKNSPLFR